MLLFEQSLYGKVCMKQSPLDNTISIRTEKGVFPYGKGTIKER